MATKKSTSSAQASDQAPDVLPREFQDVRLSRPEIDGANLPGSAVRSFTDCVADVSSGALSILRLVEWDEQRDDIHRDDPENQPAPVLGITHRGILLRLVAVNMELLQQRAEDISRWAFEQHTPEGKTELLARAMATVRHHERLAKGLRP